MSGARICMRISRHGRARARAVVAIVINHSRAMRAAQLAGEKLQAESVPRGSTNIDTLLVPHFGLFLF